MTLIESVPKVWVYTSQRAKAMTVQTVTSPSDTALQALLFSAEDARRRANGYLVRYVSTGYQGINPELLPLASPVWQLVVQYKAPTLPPIRVGFLEVNAQTGEVIPLSSDQITTIRERAREYLAATAPSTTVPH